MQGKIIGTCARGTEEAVVRELRSLDLVAEEVARGAVQVEGELEKAYSILLWSRTVSRVLVPVYQATVQDEDELYEAARQVAWEEHLAPDGSFVVDAVARGERWNQRFVALRVKDAIADHFRERVGRRPDVDRERPDVRVHLHLRADAFSLFIDLAGGPLHRRGYRQAEAEAPLRENLAASLLWLADWPRRARDGEALIDPMMGSGTLLIEAAAMGLGLAPGLALGGHGSERGRDVRTPTRWLGHQANRWAELHAQARQQTDEARAGSLGPIVGRDLSGAAVKTALRSAERAGVSALLTLERGALADAEPPVPQPGLFITNPPYGERVDGGSLISELYGEMGDVIRRRFLGWSAFVLSGNPSLQRNIGLKSASRRVLYNGGIECRLLEYQIRSEPVRGAGPGWRDLSPEAKMFENRLRKNRKRWERWAKKRGLTCYRIYDADIPEYNVAIDRYGDELLIQEYRAPRKVPEGKAERRLRDAIAVVLKEFELPREKLHLRQRKRQQGKSQYERRAKGNRKRIVEEGGLRFLVNLEDYLDTGLFMDQRPLRKRLEAEARGRRFLNLFAYTGTATVYAAHGGARESVTVDMSNTYLAWAEENFRLNGLDLSAHRCERRDCFEWLRRDQRRFDLILLAPPSYSRSKGMQGDFDLARDHAGLLADATDRLAPGGVLYFVHHVRRFELDATPLEGFRYEELTADTVAEDFARSPHRAWRIERPL